MTFSDLVPSREFANCGKTGFEPIRMKFRYSDRVGLSVTTLKLSIFELQHIAVLLHCSLQPVIERFPKKIINQL
jgi:hypothetical protein